MSLIEQALKKAQAQRSSSAAAPAAPAPVPVRAAPAAAEVVAPGPAPRHTDEHEAAAARNRAAEAAVRPTKVVEIDRTALTAAGLLAPEDQLQVLARQYRSIKRSLVA